MDPLSITATVLALSRTVLLTARDLHSLQSHFSSSTRIIHSISTECTIIGTFLSQLPALLNDPSESAGTRIEGSPELGEALKIALDHFADIHQQLNTEISYFKENPKKPGQLRFRDKIRYLWNEDGLKEMLEILRGHHVAFASMLQCFSA
jgi:hypothetical protein